MIRTMAAPKANPTQLQITVVLNPQAMDFLKANAKSGDVSATLSGWTSYWVEQQARGGILLEPTDHDDIAEANGGKRFKDSRSLTRMVMKGLHRDEGAFSFRVNVDPAHVQPLQEQATLSAMTVEELINGAINMLMTNGWLWDFSPENGRHIPFTKEMLKSCGDLCGKHSIDSSDIAGLIAEDRLMPISREIKAEAKQLIDKVDLTMADISALLAELKSAREELKKLRTAPRELVAA